MNTEGDSSTFSERLQEAIQRKNISQKALAKSVKRTEHTVSRWVRRGIVPDHATIIKIAKRCNISSLWLEKGEGPKNAEAVWGYYARKKEFNLHDLYLLYERVSEILTANKINKAQLAALADINISKDSDWWIGEGEAIVPSIWSIEKIAKATGYNKDWIWYGTGQRINIMQGSEIAASRPSTTCTHVKTKYKETQKEACPQCKEESLPMVRNYRDLAEMDTDTFAEIQTWINDMEIFKPGFTGWFRLEFQNRFPEFDSWKMNQQKKRAGNDH